MPCRLAESEPRPSLGHTVPFGVVAPYLAPVVTSGAARVDVLAQPPRVVADRGARQAQQPRDCCSAVAGLEQAAHLVPGDSRWRGRPRRVFLRRRHAWLRPAAQHEEVIADGGARNSEAVRDLVAAAAVVETVRD